jgi:hypothetical protein
LHSRCYIGTKTCRNSIGAAVGISTPPRDAVYGYLAHAFAIVEHYKVRRKTGKLLWHAFKFANFPFNKNVEPFTAIIRCTSDDSVDSALRYVARSKKPETGLKTFMKKAGGINTCANLHARSDGRRDPGHRKD